MGYHLVTHSSAEVFFILIVVFYEYILVVYCMFAAFNLLRIDATRGVQVLSLKSENLEGGGGLDNLVKPPRVQATWPGHIFLRLKTSSPSYLRCQMGDGMELISIKSSVHTLARDNKIVKW